MASDVKFRIGGALDKSVDVALGEFSKRVDKMAKQMAALMQSSQRQTVGAVKEANREKLTDEERIQREIVKIDKALTDSKSLELRKQLADKRRAVREQINEENRASRAAEREREKFASRVSNRAVRFMFPRPEGAIGYAKRVGSDLLRGIGVDTSLSSAVSRAVSLESAGIGLAQQERIANGTTKGGKYYTDIARGVGGELSTDPEKVIELMRAMTGKTGDFEGATASVKELASMTIAAGANMSEMGAAAGFVYNQLKGMPDAGERTIAVMRGIVGQTAVGAVEMEEYASQMGRIAANAKMFNGDTAKNIMTLSALAQLSIAEGGATSGADAARAVNAFAQTTSKDKRVKAFKEAGVDLFMPGGRQKKGIMQIIDESLLASKGQIVLFNKMWADTLGQKPTRAMLNAFNEAGGGKAGIEAAHKKIAPFLNVQMTEEQQKQNLADYQASTQAKVQRFQNNLDKIAASLADRVLPELENLAPIALRGAQAFADGVVMVVDHLGEAVTVAAAASIGRAFLEAGFRTAVERSLGVGSPLNSAAAQSGNALVGLSTKISQAMGLISIAILAYEAMKLAGDNIGDTRKKQATETANNAEELSTKHGADLEQGIAKAKEHLSEMKAKRAKRGSFDVGLSDWVEDTFMGGANEKKDIAATEQLIKSKEAELARFQQTGKATRQTKLEAAEAQLLANAIGEKTLSVKITNLPKNFGSPAAVDPNHRDPPPGQR